MSTDHPPTYHCRATHLTDGMHMKGELRLTQAALEFITHPHNVRQYVLRIPLDTITSVKLQNRLRWFPYGMLIKTADGHTHHLAVWKRKKLQALIAGSVEAPESQSTHA